MKKFLITASIFFLLTSISFATGSFTYSGPSTVVVAFGGTSTTATYSFSYSNLEGTYKPCLVIAVDGTVVSDDLCSAPQEGHLPSSYSVTLTPGNHTLKFSLLSVDGSTLNCNDPIIHQESTINVTARVTSKVQNVFTGGTIYVDNTTTPKTAPQYKSGYSGGSFTIGAINQSSGGYSYTWNTSGTNNSNWVHNNGSVETHYSYSQNTSYSVSNWNTDTYVTANLKKVCNLTFDTGLEAMGVTEACSIKVNGSTVEVPTSQYSVVEGNTIQVEAIDKTVLDVQLVFWKWSDGGSTVNPRTISADETETIKALYYIEEDEIAPSAPTNLSVTESEDEYAYLTWDENEELDISIYRVYRRINYGSWSRVWSTSNAFLEDTHITTTYRHGDDVQYKVTAEDIFDNESGYSSVVDIEARLEKQIIDEGIVEAAPKVYALNSNYPNPFNPTTQISYQIPNDGFVNLTVYNSLGQEVAVLVNQHQSIGRYSVQFNAANFPSGIFFYTIKADGFYSVKKMLLLK